jgi:CRISPR-associated protein Csm3
MKLERHITLNGELECVTGCRIGGTESGFEIGGIDNPIIKNPLDGLPIIPGSSLKGKIRSLLELKYNRINVDDKRGTGDPCKCGDCFVCDLFGCGDSKNTKSPTRLIFRDSFLSKRSVETVGKVLKDYTESKTEVKIDRLTNTSADPREVMRVPAGSVFNLNISVRVFDIDREKLKSNLDKLAEGFQLLEDDYLGGSGTRGYGKVKITAEDGTPMHEFIRNMKL